MRPSCTSRRRAANGRRNCSRRSTRSRRRVACACRRRTQSLHRRGHRRSIAPVSPGPSQRAGALRGANRCGAADLRVVYERGDEVSFLVRTLSRKPAARGVWVRRHAAENHGPQALARAVGSTKNAVKIGVIYSSDQVVNCMASAKRELFKAPDVCEMAQLQPYVLRSWEAEFPRSGKSSGSGPRSIVAPTSSWCSASSSWSSAKG